jgi:hypothetical protein
VEHHFVALFTLAVALVTACGSERDENRPMPHPERGEEIPSKTVTGAEATCAQLMSNIVPLKPDHGLDQYHDALPQILVDTKIVPVIYLFAPKRSGEPKIVALANDLDRGYRSERAVRRLVKELADDKQTLREVFLSQGYLFEDRPRVAAALVKVLKISDLFDEKTVYIHRGGVVKKLTDLDGEFVDDEGNRATILLNDRVSADEGDLAQPLHMSLDRVKEDTGARRIIPLSHSRDRAIVHLEYPNGYLARALIGNSGSQTSIMCIDGNVKDISNARSSAKVFWDWNRALREAAKMLVAERPGFDEPVDEAPGDQEDGKLRIAWHKAYYRHKRKFHYREEEYRVFDRLGNPAPPQVCIDFIFDTWERSSGNWFRKRKETPGKTPGYLDFSFMKLNRRHTPSVLEISSVPGGIFERYDFPGRDRVPFRRRREFASALARNSHAVREGDLLVIHGLREEDMENHYHTIIVLSTDPLTGIPTVVAGNAGRPRIRSISEAMRNAPRRSIKHRIRINPDWIEKIREAFDRGDPMVQLGDAGML